MQPTHSTSTAQILSRLIAAVFIVFLVVTVGVFAVSQADAALEPVEIACPNGETVWLEGEAPPNQGLLVYLQSRAVGGGASRADGLYRIPITLEERSGIYPVEVRVRSNRSVVGRFSCYVGVLLEPSATPTSTQTATPTDTPLPTNTRQPTAVSEATRTPTTTPSSSTTPIRDQATATRTGTPQTATATAGTSTPTRTPSPTPTVTLQPASQQVLIADIYPAESPPDLDYPEEEYVELIPDTLADIDIGGWTLVNASRADKPTFTFPLSFLAEPGAAYIVYTGVGDDDLDIGDFYWDRSESVWSGGDRAELYDASGQLVDSYVVVE
jgi:hypothetical protein